MRGKLFRALMHLRVALAHVDKARALLGGYIGGQMSDTLFATVRGPLQELRAKVGKDLAEVIFWETPRSGWPKP